MHLESHVHQDAILVRVSTYTDINACQRPIIPQFAENSDQRKYPTSHGYKHFELLVADLTRRRHLCRRALYRYRDIVVILISNTCISFAIPSRESMSDWSFIAHGNNSTIIVTL